MDENSASWKLDGNGAFKPARTETTTHGVRIYMSPERLRTLKIGETFSLDRFNDPPTHIVEFDGFGLDGCYRWKRDDGRVFIYTAEQCQRLIYHLRPASATTWERTTTQS